MECGSEIHPLPLGPLKAIIGPVDWDSIGVTAVRHKTISEVVPRGLTLALSLVLLGAASGDFEHALFEFSGHGFLPVVQAADATPVHPDSTNQHAVADCPRCSAGRISRTAMAAASTHATGPVRQTTNALFHPETPATSTARQRVDTARAPPARLIA
jgi:hypothetical protein